MKRQAIVDASLPLLATFVFAILRSGRFGIGVYLIKREAYEDEEEGCDQCIIVFAGEGRGFVRFWLLFSWM